jgi:hypothetical protein
MVGAAPSRRGSRLRKRVLLLDHDDTAVMSTAQIHYPAHVTSVRALRPDREPCTLAEWFERCHDPGVSKCAPSCTVPLSVCPAATGSETVSADISRVPASCRYLASLFSPSQLEEEHNIWTREVRKRGPADFFEGIPQLLAEFRSRGGEVVVISHSQTATIVADYGRLPETTRPHLVYGWHPDPARKKPAPWPAQQVSGVASALHMPPFYGSCTSFCYPTAISISADVLPLWPC